MADDNPIEKMTPGQILADASVAEFIKSMGLSIAEAQKALDMNSLAQVGEYVEPRPGLGGKSLLQLGLSPPFYHYQHADLSVSMQLTMKVGKTSAFGIGGKLDFGLASGSTRADARTAQITLKSQPASVTVDGTKTDATGTDLDSAGNALADKLRAPAGKFEQAYVSAKRSAPKAALDPGDAKNPILTPGAVAFLRADTSSGGIIRIVETPPPGPNTAETFKLATGKETIVTSESNKLLYARKVAKQINDLGGFIARLARDPGGDSKAPDSPGALGIALFDTGKALIKKAAYEELERVAKLIKAGNLTVDVFGYTDRVQVEEKNDKLGQDRADAVTAQLKANGVAGDRIRKTETGGETRWGTKDGVENQQFRRAEIVLADSTDLLIIVDSDGTQLQAKPLPDKQGGQAGNGFIVAKSFAGTPVADGTKLKLGDAGTPVDMKGDAVANGTDTFAANTPEAFAFNLVKAINDGTATHKARGSQRGNVVILSSADDAVTIDLVTVSGDDIKLSADGGASITKPLAAITPAGPAASKDKPNVTLAVGISVDYRSSRQFEQSVNGNSAINARLVAVPAPVEFLEEIRKFLGPDVRVTPEPPVLTPTPTPTPLPAPNP